MDPTTSMQSPQQTLFLSPAALQKAKIETITAIRKQRDRGLFQSVQW